MVAFSDRHSAGTKLATELEHLRDQRPLVLGLPRGGVVVAGAVASALDAELDVVIVRKLGLPSQPELAMGAIGEGGIRVINRSVVDKSGIAPEILGAVEEREWTELDRRAALYRGAAARIDPMGRCVVLVDDGIATGSSMRAAAAVLREEAVERLVVAVPVAPRGWERAFDGIADECIALSAPRRFEGVGRFYRDFSQTQDAEVVELLTRRAS